MAVRYHGGVFPMPLPTHTRRPTLALAFCTVRRRGGWGVWEGGEQFCRGYRDSAYRLEAYSFAFARL